MGRARAKQGLKPVRRRARSRKAPRNVARRTAGVLPVFAHDVRTGLTTVLALGELLARSDLAERERRWAFDIKTSAEYLAALTTLVIDAAKAGTGALILQRQVFRPRQLIAGLETAFRVRADSKGLRAAITIADNVPERLIGDPVR